MIKNIAFKWETDIYTNLVIQIIISHLNRPKFNPLKIKVNFPIKPNKGYLFKKCFSNGFNMISKEQKPQLYFRDNVDNTNLPFIPKIRVKPNAIKPLQG